MRHLDSAYGAQLTIPFTLFDTVTGQLVSGATHAAGDIVLYRDGAAGVTATNAWTTNGPTYELILTAAEMQAARITVVIADQDGPAFLAEPVYIDTYGHVNAAHMLENMAASALVAIAGGTHTTSSVETDLVTEEDGIIGRLATFLSGTVAGQQKRIVDYNVANGQITFDSSLTQAPSNGDVLTIT
jgi:hypothetical protein